MFQHLHKGPMVPRAKDQHHRLKAQRALRQFPPSLSHRRCRVRPRRYAFSALIGGRAHVLLQTYSISSKASGTTSQASLPSHVSYSGAKIVGTAQLPASLSAVVFPPSSQNTGILKHSGSLGVNGLSQQQTNGNSLLGTLQAPRYYRYIADGGQDNSTCGTGRRLSMGIADSQHQSIHLGSSHWYRSVL